MDLFRNEAAAFMNESSNQLFMDSFKKHYFCTEQKSFM